MAQVIALISAGYSHGESSAISQTIRPSPLSGAYVDAQPGQVDVAPLPTEYRRLAASAPSPTGDLLLRQPRETADEVSFASSGGLIA